MSETAAWHIESPKPLVLIRAAVRYRDGATVLMNVLRSEATILIPRAVRRSSLSATPE